MKIARTSTAHDRNVRNHLQHNILLNDDIRRIKNTHFGIEIEQVEKDLINNQDSLTDNNGNRPRNELQKQTLEDTKIELMLSYVLNIFHPSDNTTPSSSTSRLHLRPFLNE